jgi:formylmethanofuran dehydrogenase subunit E
MSTARLPDAELFLELVRRHGHFCPMSTLGVRIGWAAQQHRVGEIHAAVYLMRTCAVDGIQLVLKDETLDIVERAQHQLIVHDDESWLLIALRAETLRMAASYRQLSDPAMQEAVLQQLRTIDEDRLLQITRRLTSP